MADRRRIGVVLEGPPGDGSFVDHAVRAVERLRADGVPVDVRVVDDEPPDPAWDAVLAHGAGAARWARMYATEDRRIVLTDWLEDRPPAVTVVDWAWWQAAHCIGWAAARLGNRPIVLLAGPAVATQRRIAHSLETAVADAGGPSPSVYHLEGFRDHEGARRVRDELSGRSPGLLVSTGGPASEGVCQEARDLGWATAGFARGATDHTYAIASDMPGALHDLLRRMSTRPVDDAVVQFGFASGRLEVRPGREAPAEAQALLGVARSQLAP